jgi:ankyrin repeat protein
VQLLRTCSSKRLFPPWLKVVATSRDVPEVAQLKSWRRIDLGSDARLAENRQAIRAYINIRLDEADSPLKARVDEMAEAVEEAELEALQPEPEGAQQPETFRCHTAAHPYFEQLIEQSGGNFLYAATALDDVEAGMGDLADVGSLPTGLDELFLHFFERLFGDADSEAYRRARPIFQAIMASQGGVTEAALLACLRVSEPLVDERALKVALQGLRQFLKAVPGEVVLQVPLPTCDSGHAMTTDGDTSGWSCAVCGSRDGFSVCSKGCSYYLCKGCSGPLRADFVQPRMPAGRPVERLVAYHLSFVEWLRKDHEYQCDEANGHRALGVVQFAALASVPSLDPFAALASEHLGCDARLSAQVLRKLAAKKAQVAASVWSMARHLGAAVAAEGADPGLFGSLWAADVQLDANAKFYGEGAWVGARCVSVAAGKGDVPTLTLLLSAGADMRALEGDRSGFSPLHCAALHDQVAALEAMISREPAAVCDGNTTGGGWTGLHVAARGGAVRALRLLADAGLSLDQRAIGFHYAPIHIGAMYGQVDALIELRALGADVEAEDEVGRTALHLATGCIEALRYLLSAEVGAELEAQDQEGSTAVHLAAWNGHVEALRYLLSAEVGAELEAKNQYGRTALHSAAAEGQVEALRYLLSAEVGAEVEAQDQ